MPPGPRCRGGEAAAVAPCMDAAQPAESAAKTAHKGSPHSRARRFTQHLIRPCQQRLGERFSVLVVLRVITNDGRVEPVGHHVAGDLDRVSAAHAACCTACHGVGSHAVATRTECAIPLG